MKEKIFGDDLNNCKTGRSVFPFEYGLFDITKKKSEEEIEYYNWDLSFKKDVFAKKNDNFGRDEVQIIFNMNQDIQWTLGDPEEEPDKCKCIDMKKGEVCIYRNNNVNTSMNYYGGKTFNFKSIQMPTKKFSEILKKYFSEKDRKKIEKKVYYSVTTAYITADMYRILSEIDSADRYKEFKNVFLESKMIELIACVLYSIMQMEDNEENRHIAVGNEDVYRIGKIRERIQLRPYDDYPAEEIARALSMSVSKLNRLFGSLYGISFHAYLINQRLEYAAMLLVDKDATVTEAALESGYNNISLFSKSFRNKYGITPKKFSQKAKMSEKC